MATYFTYNSLVSDLQNYLERGGSLAADGTVYNQIPRIINAAERRIVQELKLQGTIEVLVDWAGLPSGVPVVAKPDRWRQTISLKYGSGTNLNAYTPLFPRSYDFCRTYWPDDTVLSVPKFYADYDYTHWIIAPTPDITRPLEVLAYMQPQLLDSGNQTNFFTNYTPNLLLYAAMLEASLFLKDDVRIQYWQAAFAAEKGTLVPQDLQKIMDRAAVRTSA